MTLEEIMVKLNSNDDTIIDKRMFRRRLVDIDAVLTHWTSDYICKIKNVSENGVGFVVKKSVFPDLNRLNYGSELVFKLVEDIEAKKEHIEDEAYIIPEYRCFLVHVNDLGDDYEVGVVTSSMFYDRLNKVIDI